MYLYSTGARSFENRRFYNICIAPRPIVHFSTENEEINLFPKVVTYSTLRLLFFSEGKLKIDRSGTLR